MDRNPRTFSIIGPGRAGFALKAALTHSGMIPESTVGRSPRPDDVSILTWSDRFEILSDVVFIATQDSEIESAAAQLLRRIGTEKPIVMHLSGALNSSILGELRDHGCAVGSFHPLLSISEPTADFCGVYFCLEGDDRAVQAASAIVADLGGRAFSIPRDSKSLYHAAAVTACGHLVALFEAAIQMLTACGIEPDAAKDALLPLVVSTIANLETLDTHEALTGPFARGDAPTIAAHLEAIGSRCPDKMEIYTELARIAVDLAEKRGTDPSRLADVRRLFDPDRGT